MPSQWILGRLGDGGDWGGSNLYMRMKTKAFILGVICSIYVKFIILSYSCTSLWYVVAKFGRLSVMGMTK